MQPLERLTIGDLLHRTAERYPDSPAFFIGDSTQNYRDFDKRVTKTARSLMTAGIGKGDRVAVLGETTVELLSLFYAIERLGGVCVLLNTALETEELEILISELNLRALFVGKSFQKDKHLSSVCIRISSAVMPTLVLSFTEDDKVYFPTLYEHIA